MKKLWLLLGSLVLLNTMLFAAPKTVHFATEATYPPFEFISETGEIKGFEIDIANALCQEMKAKCIFSNQSFNSLIPSLQLGKFDAIIAALGITAERKKQVSFTHAYYEPSASFIASRERKYTLASIDGKTIGAQEGSTFEKFLRDRYKKSIVKTYTSIQDAFLDLTAERIDMVIVDTPIGQTWLQKNPAYIIVDAPIVDHAYFGSGYSIAVRKTDTALLTALNQALTTIQSNGTYQTIYNHYFGS